MTSVVQQVETATVIGSCTLTGNAKVTVTSKGMTGSPLAVSVALDSTRDTTAALCALQMRYALALNSTIAAKFQVSGTSADIILTARVAAPNDTTLNIAIANDTTTGLTPAPTSTHTTAGVGINNGYCTLDDLKSSDVLRTPTSANDDAFLADIITAVSREIDTETSRYFYKSAADETRYFDAKVPDYLYIDDTVSITTLYTDDGSRTYPYTWATTDFDLLPYEAISLAEPEPYRFIQVAPTGKYSFPITTHQAYIYPHYGSRFPITKGVKITGIFGWPQVPTLIAKACLLWSARTFMRYAAPLGVTAMSALGQMTVKVPPPDPDVEMMIMNYSRPAV